MTKLFSLRTLALAVCSGLAVCVPAVQAQEPTPVPQQDLSYLISDSPSGKPAPAPVDAAASGGKPAPALAWPGAAAADASAHEPATSASPDVHFAPGGEEPTPADSDSAAGTTEDPTVNQDVPATAEPSPRQAQPVVQGAASDLQAGENTPAPRIELIRERYPNRRVKIEREVTQDALGNYLNHGIWKMWNEQGTLIAEGRNVEGYKLGVWHRWHARAESPLFSQYPYSQFVPPFISQAEFKDGQIDGLWTFYDGKQRKISQWAFSKGQRHGLSMWWHPNGKKLREITYKDGAIDGEIVEFTESGQVANRAVFQQGRRLAPRVEKYPDGAKKTQGMYLHAPIVVKTPDDWWNARPAVFTHVGKDERHGDWMAWYPNGQEQLRGVYQNDLENGLFTWWYQNGQKATEGEYKAGRQQGTWVWWHKNGQKATEGGYRDGDQIGRWTVWNEEGRVTQASEHDNTAASVKVEPRRADDTMAPPAVPHTATAPRLLPNAPKKR